LPKDVPLQQFRGHYSNVNMEAFTRTYHLNAKVLHFSVFALLSLLGAGNTEGNVKQHTKVILRGSVAAWERMPFEMHTPSTVKGGADK
jgi:hypothetical protein